MNTQYWEEEIETMSREKLQELQLQRLKIRKFLASITLLLTIYSPWMISVKFLLLQKQICALTILLG